MLCKLQKKQIFIKNNIWKIYRKKIKQKKYKKHIRNKDIDKNKHIGTIIATLKLSDKTRGYNGKK